VELMFQIVYELPDGKGYRYSGGYFDYEDMEQARRRLEQQGARVVRVDRGIFRPADDVDRGLMGPRVFGPPG
jgi:hypothetical protein